MRCSAFLATCLLSIPLGFFVASTSASGDEPEKSSPREKQPKAEAKVDASEVDAGILGMSLKSTARGKVVVASVSPESPAAIAGLHKDDELVGFDTYKVTTLAKLTDFAKKLIERKQPGDEIEILAIRGQKELPFVVTLPERANPVAPPPEYAPQATADGEIVLCMLLQQEAGELITVVEVAAQSPPALAGIRPGDRIVTIDDVKVQSIADLQQMLGIHVDGDVVRFGLNRNDRLVTADVTIAPCEFVRTSAGSCPEAAALAIEVRQLRSEIDAIHRILEALATRLEAVQPR